MKFLFGYSLERNLVEKCIIQSFDGDWEIVFKDVCASVSTKMKIKQTI